MKKIVFTAAIFAAATAFAADNTQTAAAPATEKGWTHFVGAGVTVPVSKYNVEGSDFSLVSAGLNLSYMGISKSGFAVRADLSSGATFTDDVKYNEKEDADVGTYVAGEVGLGYGFVNTPDWTVAVFATVGVEGSVFTRDTETYKHPDLGKVDWTRSVTLGALTLGGDVVVRKALGDHVGVFASVGGRWAPVAVWLLTDEYDNDDVNRKDTFKSDKSDGGFSVVPTVGAMWSF
ncbi:MAG: hypothetical protein IKS02_08650 [Fibrobacter sp.]|nr:hypothetical protein [Fibrobacter sp.]